LEYLGLNIIIKENQIELSQKGFIKKVINKFNILEKSSTPSTDQLFNDIVKVQNYYEPVEEIDRKSYHSLVMSLMFLAVRTRPDILKEIIFLSTKVKDPNIFDFRKLQRVANYINATEDDKLFITESNNYINIYIDASFNVHSDARGHSGLLIQIGNNIIRARSTKQKLVSKSSTESELIAIYDALYCIDSIIHLLKELGFEDTPIIYQDNLSTMKIIENGQNFTGRSKHISLRYFYIKELIDDKKFKIEYLSTKDMKADILTKPLSGNTFRRMKRWLLNMPEDVP
jgi:hypothetical protein